MKKVIALMLCVVLAFGLFACAKKAPSNKLEQIKEAGVLIVGTSPDYPPYEFVIAGEGGEMEYKGIDVSIAQEIAKDLGVDLKIEAVDFNGLDSALQMGTIDMILAAYNPSEERAPVMDFSDVYYIDEVVALVKADAADTYTDLATSFSGKKVGVQLGTTLESDYYPQMTGAEKIALKKVTELVTELKAGALDAIVVEKPIAESYIKNNPELAIASAISFDAEATGYVVGLPKDSAELKDAVNATIKRLVDNNSIATFAEEAQDIQDQAILE
ncbi:MAG: transporter substrate-binding domain-containing protein [Eubacteriales bacterium]|nr:transporter substrate-binding domain-containing protein [Eubacteriales bacterium]